RAGWKSTLTASSPAPVTASIPASSKASTTASRSSSAWPTATATPTTSSSRSEPRSPVKREEPFLKGVFPQRRGILSRGRREKKEGRRKVRPEAADLLPSSFFLLPPRESLPALPSKKGGRILRMWAIQGPAENFQYFPCHRSGSVQTRPIFQKAISREGKGEKREYRLGVTVDATGAVLPGSLPLLTLLCAALVALVLLFLVRRRQRLAESRLVDLLRLLPDM